MRDLMDMRKEIETSQSKLERAQGVLDNVKSELKKDYGFDDVEEAEAYLEETEEAIKNLEKKAKKLQERISQELDEIHDRTKQV